MQVEIEVALAAARAQQQADALFNTLDRARVVAGQITVAASNIRLPTVSGGGTAGSAASVTANTNAMNAMTAAIARNRATAATAQAATTALNNAISASVAASNAAAAAITNLANAQARQGAGAQQQAAVMGGMLGAVTRLAAGYITLRSAWDFTGNSINQSIALENLTNTLTATSGSATQAAADLAFLRSESQRIGINFIASAEAFVRFDSAVKGAGLSSQFARDAFTAVAEAGRRFGLNADRQRLILLALEQMTSKGVISMEELRRQLGESLPGAFNMAAKAAGMTTREFNKLVESGKLMAADFLPKFIDQMKKDMPAGAEAVASTAAEVNRLTNAWQAFLAAVGKSVPVKEVAKVAANILTELTPLHAIDDAAQIEANKKRAQRRSDYFKEISQQTYPGLKSAHFGYGGGGSLPSVEDIDAYLKKEDELAKREKARTDLRNKQLTDIFVGDPAKQEEQQAAYSKIYGKFMTEALDEEARKRQEIIDRYAANIEKIKANEANLPGWMVESAVNKGKDTQAVRLAQFDEEQADKRHKESLDAAIKSQKDLEDSAKRLRDIQIDLIPDEEEQKIERIKDKFEAMRKNIVANAPWLFATSNIGQQIDDKQSQEIAQIRNKAKPTSATPLNTDFGSLYRERSTLQGQLADAKTVENFEDIARRISDINRALSVQLQADNAKWIEAFKFGFQEVQDSWGSMAERMSSVGATLADSMERNITDSLVNIALATEDPKEAFANMSRAIIADLVRVAIQQLIVKNLLSGFSGLFGSGATTSPGITPITPGPITSAVSGHSGMVVGFEGMTTQFAPRFHGGSGPVGDEQLAMLRKQEVVLTPEQMKAIGGRGKAQPTTIINLFDRKVFDEMRAANPDAVVNEIGRNKSLIRQILQ